MTSRRAVGLGGMFTGQAPRMISVAAASVVRS
jgi:hypothetical protein